MNFEQAQKDMSFSYAGGGAGVFVSGFVWCAAGFVALLFSNQASMLTLFFGGMAIHPVGLLLVKATKRPGVHSPDNPLGKLALEGTIILFVGLFLAFFVAKLQGAWFYPIMLMAIGVRYLTFNTLYGSRIYWLLGALLIFSGMFCMLFGASFVIGAFIGGVVEIIFSVFIYSNSKGLELKAT